MPEDSKTPSQLSDYERTLLRTRLVYFRTLQWREGETGRWKSYQLLGEPRGWTVIPAALIVLILLFWLKSRVSWQELGKVVLISAVGIVVVVGAFALWAETQPKVMAVFKNLFDELFHHTEFGKFLAETPLDQIKVIEAEVDGLKDVELQFQEGVASTNYARRIAIEDSRRQTRAIKRGFFRLGLLILLLAACITAPSKARHEAELSAAKMQFIDFGVVSLAIAGIETDARPSAWGFVRFVFSTDAAEHARRPMTIGALNHIWHYPAQQDES